MVPRPTLRPFCFLLAVCLFGLTGCRTIYDGWLRRRVGRQVSASRQTAHLDLRFRPGTRAAAGAADFGDMAERELARICGSLEVPNDARYTLFLFDDERDFHDVTKATAGVGGFALLGALYVPFENRQAVIHEMVHLVAHAKIGDSPSPFLTEGLGNALLASSHGVQVHAVAKFYRTQKQLPRLGTMLSAAGFRAQLTQPHPLNVYDIAASWVRFLLETEGAAKVKRYYAGGAPGAVFGRNLDELESAWLAALDRYVLRPEVNALLATRAGHRESDTITLITGEAIVLQGEEEASVAGRDAGPPAYQWRKNGAKIAGATNATFSLAQPTPADSGTYVVIITDRDGHQLGAAHFVVDVLDPELTARP